MLIDGIYPEFQNYALVIWKVSYNYYYTLINTPLLKKICISVTKIN